MICGIVKRTQDRDHWNRGPVAPSAEIEILRPLQRIETLREGTRMSSPFSIFRRNQRILMVITTGLAMISFVLLGAVSDPRDLPTPLVVIFLAAMAGGLAG